MDNFSESTFYLDENKRERIVLFEIFIDKDDTSD